jgi:hypothetical protein
VCPNLCREGVGGIVVVTPITIEVWMSSWWNDRGDVGSERGSHIPIHCARSCPSYGGNGCRGGAPVASRLARGLHASLGRGKSTLRGSGALMLTLRGLDEAKIIPDRAQGLGALMMSWGSVEAKGVPKPRVI